MHKGRLEAFSDGVIAIIITIMVLELKAPRKCALPFGSDSSPSDFSRTCTELCLRCYLLE